MLAALATAAALGPYFSWEPWTADGHWRPWRELSDGEVVAERVTTAAGTLAARTGLPLSALPPRVIASVTFLGYASRIVSPLLGAAVVGDAIPILTPADLWWRPTPGGPLPLAYAMVPARGGADLDPTAIAQDLVDLALDGLLAAPLASFREQFSLSPKVLYGNVASALAGAAGMIAEQAPTYAERAAEVVSGMLSIGPLVGTATLVRPDPLWARRFLVRHNCCLYYRIPGGGTCGDCVLTPEAERRRGWDLALRRR